MSLLVEVLGTDRLEFDRERNGIELPRAALAAPLSTHDPALLALLDRQAEAALALRGSSSRFVGALRQRIRDRLRDGPPTLEEAARALAMSPRTLQRRLAEDEGTSWNVLVDEVRKELAVRWVEEGARPLGEIAFLLGYSELSAFLRALKRWTGRSASELRPVATAAKVARAVNRSGARGHRRRAR